MKKPYHIQPRQAVLARYKDGRHTVKISFPYDPEDVAIVKSIPGRKYNADHKFWTCPPTTKALHILEDAAFVIDRKLRKYIEEGQRPTLPKISGLRGELFLYQRTGVAFLEAKNGRALIGDDMGLGKTIQAIAWLQMHPEVRPVIIICPASVKLNWAKEIRNWMGAGDNKIEIIEGQTPYILHGSLLLINYDLVHYWLPTLVNYDPKAVILDECQMIKSNKTKRTKAVQDLGKHARHLIALSGTPIVNRPIEFYNIIQLLNRDLFPNWLYYTQRYCNRKHNGFGWDVSGASNTEELHEILSESIMIRRSKQEVLTDLPDKIRSFIPIELHPEGREAYEEAEDNFIAWMQTYRGKEAAERASMAEALTEIEVLKQVAANAKIPQTTEWIDDFLDSGQKLVVFCTHRTFVKALANRYGKKAVTLDGQTPPKSRQQVVDQFQTDPSCQLFIGNIKAAGVGITLTAASNVALLELPWTPGELVQAEDRCHRIGQKDTVNVYYLLAEHTIEEKVASLLDKKRKVLDSVLDGVETDDTSLLMELIENY